MMLSCCLVTNNDSYTFSHKVYAPPQSTHPQSFCDVSQLWTHIFLCFLCIQEAQPFLCQIESLTAT